jgi:probable HAF family extracellular repeat protein
MRSEIIRPVLGVHTFRPLVFASFVGTVGLLAEEAPAAGYSVTIFKGNSVNGHSLGMTGDGIDSHGDIVGEVPAQVTVDGVLANTTHGALVTNGSFANLGDLDNDANARFGDGARAVAINTNGLVVGWSFNANSVGSSPFKRPVSWQNGKVRDLGAFPHQTTGYDDVEATNINGAGQITGFAACSCSLPSVAWTLQNGVVTELSTLGGAAAQAWGINDAGQIVGASDTSTSGLTHATLWQNGAPRDLGALLGGHFSEAVSINASGLAVGFSTLAETSNGTTLDFGDRHAVIFRNGTLTDLTPSLQFGRSAVATSINTSSQIVGFQNGRATIWQNGVATDLNTLIPSNAGVTLTSANGINDNGQIVGSGHISGSSITVAYILNPQ